MTTRDVEQTWVGSLIEAAGVYIDHFRLFVPFLLCCGAVSLGDALVVAFLDGSWWGLGLQVVLRLTGLVLYIAGLCLAWDLGFGKGVALSQILTRVLRFYPSVLGLLFLVVLPWFLFWSFFSFLRMSVEADPGFFSFLLVSGVFLVGIALSFLWTLLTPWSWVHLAANGATALDAFRQGILLGLAVPRTGFKAVSGLIAVLTLTGLPVYLGLFLLGAPWSFQFLMVRLAADYLSPFGALLLVSAYRRMLATASGGSISVYTGRQGAAERSGG